MSQPRLATMDKQSTTASSYFPDDPDFDLSQATIGSAAFNAPSTWPQFADGYQNDASYDCFSSLPGGNDFMDWSSSPTLSTASFPASLAGATSPTAALGYDFNKVYYDSDYPADGLMSPVIAPGAAAPGGVLYPVATPQQQDQQQQKKKKRSAPDDDSGNNYGRDEHTTQNVVAAVDPSRRASSKRSPTSTSTKHGRKSAATSARPSKSPTDAQTKARTATGPGLRTASRKPKHAAASEYSSPSSLSYSVKREDDGDDDSINHLTSLGAAAAAAATGAGGPDRERRQQRHNHNLVEKQYRNRLNSQFEHLLTALHVSDAVVGGAGGGAPSSAKGTAGGPGGGESCCRRMSKAEVLDIASRHIHTLEKERRQLQAERKTLLESVEMMQAAVLRQRQQQQQQQQGSAW